MHSKLFFLLEIGILLLGANIGGIISKKLKQPAVLGQILVGIVLGMGFMEMSEFINHISEIGVILLMFIAGLETDVDELKASGASSTTIAIAGVVFPVVLVGGGAYFLTGDWIISLFLGIISTATSVSISVQTLQEMGFLKTKQGVGILGAAIIDDIIGIILLTLMIGIVRPGANSGIGIVILKIVLFFVIALILGSILVKVLERVSPAMNIKNRIVSYAIIACLGLAFLSEEMGVAAITGAYFAGVIFSMTPYHHKVSHDVQLIASTFFTPIFFVGIGLGVDVGSMATALGLGLVILILGSIGKIFGCGLGAKMMGFNNKHSLQIGIGMVPRAEVAIIITNLGVQIGILGQKEFGAIIMMVVATTLITPSLLKWSFKDEVSKEQVS